MKTGHAAPLATEWILASAALMAGNSTIRLRLRHIAAAWWMIASVIAEAVIRTPSLTTTERQPKTEASSHRSALVAWSLPFALRSSPVVIPPAPRTPARAPRADTYLTVRAPYKQTRVHDTA